MEEREERTRDRKERRGNEQPSMERHSPVPTTASVYHATVQLSAESMISAFWWQRELLSAENRYDETRLEHNQA